MPKVVAEEFCEKPNDAGDGYNAILFGLKSIFKINSTPPPFHKLGNLTHLKTAVQLIVFDFPDHKEMCQ